MDYYENKVKAANSLMLANHGSRIDWMIGMYVGYIEKPVRVRVGFVCEKVIKYMPFIGWYRNVICEDVFVDRSFKLDKINISTNLNDFTEVCTETVFAEGFMALTCFLVSWLCIGMGFGGYTEDPVLFPFFWVAHAAPAVLGYCTCTFLIPIARFSESGIACAALAPGPGKAVQAVYIVHAGLFFCYVMNMLSVTYLSWIKPTFGAFVSYKGLFGALAVIEAIVFGALSNYGVLEASAGLPAPKSKVFGLF